MWPFIDLTFKLVTNCDPKEYKYYGYSTGFDVRREVFRYEMTVDLLKMQ